MELQQEMASNRASPSVLTVPFRIEADDGYSLGATRFVPEDPVGTVIVHGATATPSSYYRRFAEHLAAQGLRVVTYDYRGVGASRPPTLRGFQATMSEWARLDAAAVHRVLRERWGSEPFAVVGHSFGGQLLGLLPDPGSAAGALLVGAQFGYYRHWPARDRFRLNVLWRAVVPALSRTVGYVPGRVGIGEDLPRGVAEEWARWCTHPDYLLGEHPEARAAFAALECPLLFYSFTDDDYAPRPAVDALLRHLPKAELDHRRVAPEDHGGLPIGHFGFFRPRFEDTLWQDATRFFTGLFGGKKIRSAGRSTA